jgi:hypothetical protein
MLNWNDAPYHLGLGSDWPGKLRRNMASQGYPFWDMVADYYIPGVVIYWFEPTNAIPVPVPYPYEEEARQPNRRAIRRPNWSPVPLRQPTYIIAEMGCYLLISVGGAIVMVGVANDATVIGVIDDVIAVPVGLYLIDLGQRLAVLIPNTAPGIP